MAVIHPFNASTPNTETYSRLFLREEELQFGLAAMFEVVARLKELSALEREKFGLTWADAKTLIAIGAKSDTVLNLAMRLSVTKQAFTKTLRELEKSGLITRVDDKRDRRRKTISLTKKGQETEKQVSAAMREALAQAYRNAGAEAVYGSDQVLWAILEPRK
jgi:DNA-binding MarR family transcriptional regulator